MQRKGADLLGQEYQLRNRVRHFRRLKWASRGVGVDEAAAAFAFFAEEGEPLEVVIGRLIVILDHHADVFERT